MILQPMPPIQHAGDKFEYILTVIKDGITIHTSNINNYTITRRNIPTNDIFVPYDITVKAKNEIGESNAPLVVYKGYSAEDSKCLFDWVHSLYFSEYYFDHPNVNFWRLFNSVANSPAFNVIIIKLYKIICQGDIVSQVKGRSQPSQRSGPA